METTTSTEHNKAIVKRFAEEPWSTGNLAVLDDIVDPTYVLHYTHYPDATLDDVKEAIRTTRRAFPDLTVTVEDMIAEGDKVVYRWTMRGTHHGEYQGIPATGKPVTFTGITIVCLVNGKIIEDRFEWNGPRFQLE